MMKWMGLWTLLIYLRLEKSIADKLEIKSYIYFTLVLTLTTCAKPNFFLAAAPVMFIFLVADMITKKAPVGRLLLFASSVIPSFIVIYLQNNVLFEQKEDTGLIFAPGRAMCAHTGYLIPVSILSIAFPLMVMIFHIRDLAKNRYMLFAWLCAGIGYLQYFLFTEEGARALDANLSWGYAFTIILIFGISLVQWTDDIKNRFAGMKILSKAWIVLSGCVLLWHTWCGVLFFGRLLSGVSYMMWG